MIDLLTILKQIDEAGATFRSLGEAIETESAAGRMMMQMLGCFAQFEREIIMERINRGLAHARANGRLVEDVTSYLLTTKGKLSV
jgi:DNA invertase Pin-like site-specific DNA recombinase